MSHKQRLNWILSVAGALVLWGALTLLFVFYYDLNDDVMIGDILSGIYTGKPDAHNNQMLYPISILIAGLYYITDRIPWFGLFEICCMVLAYIIIAARISSLFDIYGFERSGIGGRYTDECEAESDPIHDRNKRDGIPVMKVLCVLFLALLFAGLMMWELVNIQYTVVAGMLTAAAAIWLYTGDKEKGHFVYKNIPAIILVIVAFNIRSELVLLLSPLLAAVAICKWSEEEYRWDRYVICGYLGVALGICLLMLCSLGIDRVAYRTPEWKEYRRFFDARTELYDFTGIPDYDENEEFYIREGISREQHELLMDYNYYLDDSIDADMLERIVNGVREGRAVGRSTYGSSIREAVWEYVHNALDISIAPVLSKDRIMLTSDIDQSAPDNTADGISADCIFVDESIQHKPFNVIILLLYLALITIGYLTRDDSLPVKIVSLIVLRTVPWMYIYLQGRVLGRITHPLYMLEIMLLAAMLVKYIAALTRHIEAVTDSGAGQRMIARAGVAYSTGIISTILIIFICLAVIPSRAGYIAYSQQAREQIGKGAKELYGFTSSHPDIYYYIDTYSTVDWTEKIFDSDRYTKKNTQLLGGWIGNSPLDMYKRSGCADESILLKDDLMALTDAAY